MGKLYIDGDDAFYMSMIGIVVLLVILLAFVWTHQIAKLEDAGCQRVPVDWAKDTFYLAEDGEWACPFKK